MTLLPSPYVDQLLAGLPTEVRELARKGLHDLEAPAARLALEVVDAERADNPFAKAARQATRFPLISFLHFGMQDALQYELPKELLEPVRDALRQMLPVDFTNPRRVIFAAAVAAEGGPLGAIARLFLYEAIRLNLTIATWERGADLEASGCLLAMEDEAERTLRDALKEPAVAAPDAQPLNYLVADAMAKLLRLWDEYAATISRCTAEYRAHFDRLVEVAEVAQQSGAAQAAVVRAALALPLEAEKVGSQQTLDRHPLLFKSTNAVDKTRSRLTAAVAKGLPAPRTRVIDLLLEIAVEDSDHA